MLPADVKLSVDVPAFNVVAALSTYAVAVALLVSVDAPQLKEVAIPAVVVKFENANAYPAVSNDPLFKVNPALLHAAPSAQPQPTPLTVNPPPEVNRTPELKVFPVVDPVSTVSPVPVRSTPVLAMVTLPWQFSIPVPAMVTLPAAGPFIVNGPTRRFIAAARVTVYAVAFDAELKITVSTDVGTEAPPAPPDEADQLVVVVRSHVPVPPTQ